MGRGVDLTLNTPDQPAEALGLVWGYCFDEQGVATQLSGLPALDALNRRDTWVWLHFDLDDARSLPVLRALPHLPREALDLLTGTDERTRIDTIDDPHGAAVAGVVVDFERGAEPDPRRMVAWRFCMLPHALISARRHPVQTMQAMDTAMRSGRRFAGVLQLFDGIIHAFIGTLFQVSQDLGNKLDTVEDELLDEDENTGDFEGLGLIRRNASRLLRHTQPLGAMLVHMLAGRPAWFTEEAAEDCRHLVGRVQSVVADLLALQDRARALQDEIQSRQIEKTNQRLMLISVFSAVLLPPTLISGVFGMNVDGLPWKENPYGFVYTIGLMGISIAGLMALLRRMRLI